MDITYITAKNESIECEICYKITPGTGGIKCDNQHIFCEQCFITYYLQKKKCPVCFNTSHITWYIPGDINYYKYGKLQHYMNDKIYISDVSLGIYFKSVGFKIINKIEDNCIIYNESDRIIDEIVFNNNNTGLRFIKSLILN